MPQQFEWCTKQEGSRVRSRRLNKTEYQRICFIGGKGYPDYPKKYKKVLKKK